MDNEARLREYLKRATVDLRESHQRVRELEQQLKIDTSADVGHAVPQLEPGVKEENDNMPRISKLQIELLVSAFAADSARIATLQRWLEAGLEIGNHTYSHPRIAENAVSAFLDDIVKGEVITRPLLEARGKKLVWFRYPFLATGNGPAAQVVEEFLAQRGYQANSKTITVSDEILVDTLNLKR